MGKGFLKFKRKLWIGAVVRALLVAFSVGIITVAIQWLNAKMTGISPDFFLYGWRGALPAVVGFAFVLGLVVVLAEPAVHVLEKQVEGVFRSVAVVSFYADNKGFGWVCF